MLYKYRIRCINIAFTSINRWLSQNKCTINEDYIKPNITDNAVNGKPTSDNPVIYNVR
jgi:hypothetical protein